jgi:PAS domain S-box-containing protein
MTEDDSRASCLRQHELCQFLKFARSRIAPADLGIRSAGRRRVQGLRRDEVAALCGVSVAWYTWFETGRRGTRVSPRLIRAVAEALRLSDDETIYLFSLAIPEMPKSPCPTRRDIHSLLTSIGAAFAQLPLSAVTDRFAACESFPVGVYLTRFDGTILYANESLYRLLGYGSKTAYMKLNVPRDLYARPEQRAAWQREIEAKGSLQDAAATIRRRDGTYIDVRDSAYAVRSPDLAGTCYFGTWEGHR